MFVPAAGVRVAIVEYDNLVDAEDGKCPSYLADESSFQIMSLRTIVGQDYFIL